MSKTYIIYLLTILSLFIIVGCSNDKSTEPEVTIPQELVATWIYQSAIYNGMPIHPGFLLGWLQATATARFTVNEDGTYIYEELDSSEVVIWTESGTAEVDGDSTVITITNNDDGPVEPPEIFDATWAIYEDELTLTTIIEGNTVVFVATRQDSN